MAKGSSPLNVAELAQIKALRASGLTFYAISRQVGRAPQTVKRACLDPAMAAEIEQVKVTLADRFEDLATRMVVSISDEDITRINAYQRTLSAAIATDKMRLLTHQSTENISLHAIIEAIERDDRKQREREGQTEAVQEKAIPQTVP